MRFHIDSHPQSGKLALPQLTWCDMCLMVWLGSARPLATVVLPKAPDPLLGYFNVTAEPPNAPVRVQFLQPYVGGIGSHEGCGCGFCSQQIELNGYDRVADVMPLLGALLDNEREDFLAQQRSRERLRDLVVTALCDGEVEVFSCWVGDETCVSGTVEEVTAEYFAMSLDPLREGTKYVVR